ncbi:MAG: 23S rRNA (guanosine(2251)-2'-O)-methyltransferase RlmB [Candidatus Nanopelagicales bacterium]
MAGNSRRQGAMKDKSKKKPRTVGSGGNRRQKLEGKGPTPKAEERTSHVAKQRKEAAERVAAKEAKRSGAPRRSGKGAENVVAGRNQVLEALNAGVPAVSLHVQRNIDSDPRIRDAMARALERGITIKEHGRDDLSDLVDGVVHQGIALTIEPYQYLDLVDVLGLGTDRRPALLVILDGVTDTRNLGAIARSAAAFGATGLVIPSRRSATVTAAAWRTSAGAFAHVPVAMVPNLSNAIEQAKQAGFMVVGLAGEADSDITAANLGNEPVAIVVGSEGKGLGRLVAENCDILASIAISDAMESLNVSVAAAIAMHSVVTART